MLSSRLASEISILPWRMFQKELKKRGVAVTWNAVNEAEGRSDTKNMSRNTSPPIRKPKLGNLGTFRQKGLTNTILSFPAPLHPQVYELYWSASQIRARAHPKLYANQKLLMSTYVSKA